MAGWCSDSENEGEIFNRNLFNRKCFAFEGLSEEKENTLKKIVKVRFFLLVLVNNFRMN